MKRQADLLLLAMAVSDQVLVAAVLTFTWGADLRSGGLALFGALLIVPFWSYLHRYFGLYDSHRLDGWRSVVAATVTASTVGFLLASSAFAVAGLWDRLPELAGFTLTWLALVLVSRGVLYNLLYTVRKRGVDHRRTCVIGSWEKAAELEGRFRSHPEWGLQVDLVGVGPPRARRFFRYVDGASGGPAGAPPEATALDGSLEDVLRDHVVDEILIVARPQDVEEEKEAVELSRRYGVQCRVSLESGDMTPAPAHVEYFPGQLAWTVHDTEPSSVKLGVKRVVDVGVSAALLAILAPLFLLLAGLVKLSSPGPVFYRQERTGLRGREFVLVKFRTMIVDAESMLQLVAHRNMTGGPAFKDSRDWRVTPIGRILRRFSLDELPQLVNVLRGEMSLVGPRPLPLHESVAIEGEFRRRFNMKPGITCRWQVSGRSEIGFRQWMQLDVEYVDNWSLAEDAKLLLLTVPAVLSGKGAY